MLLSLYDNIHEISAESSCFSLFSIRSYASGIVINAFNLLANIRSYHENDPTNFDNLKWKIGRVYGEIHASFGYIKGEASQYDT